MEIMTAQRQGVIRRWAREFDLTLEKYLSLCETQKRCQKCKKWKPRTEFAYDRSRRDGLNVRCRPCGYVKERKPTNITPAMRDALRERNRVNKWSKGRTITEDHKALLSSLRIEEGANGTGSFYGKNNPNWKGGISPTIHIARTVSVYREWRMVVFARDHYTCVRCKDKRGGNLHAHHIKKFSDFPELRYEVSNGETLCFDCHAKEHDVPNSYRKRRYERRKARISTRPRQVPISSF